jgi:hypothetical protein
MFEYELCLCDYRCFIRSVRGWKGVGNRIVNARFLSAMAEHATGIPAVGMPVDEGRNAGNRENGNDNDQEILSPVFAHQVH